MVGDEPARDLDESEEIEALAFEMADEFGVRYLQAIGPYECPLEQAVDGFGRLCDRAAAHGVLVGIEWLPYTNIATAADAQAIVRGCRAVRMPATAPTSGITCAAPTTCR